MKISLIYALILFLNASAFGQFKTDKNYNYVEGPIKGLAVGVLGNILTGKKCLIDSTGKELT